MVISRKSIKIKFKRISVASCIDFFSFLTILLFSTNDYIVRLVPSFPCTMLSYMCLGALIVLAFLSRTRFDYRMILFFVIAYTMIFFSILIGEHRQVDYINTLFFSMSSTTKLWVYLITFSLVRDEKKWNRNLLSLAYVIMILMIITVMSGLYSSEGRELNYLGLGITGAMWIPIIIQKAFLSQGKHRIIHLCSAVVLTAFVTIYGNRGSVVAIFTFVIYCFWHHTKLKRKVLISVIIGLFVCVIYYLQNVIIGELVAMVNSLGIISRNLTLLLSGQISYTTHRMDEIWLYSLDAISEKWVMGYGLCYDRVLGGGISIYAHNLVLETWLSFGVILGTILLVVHFTIGIRNCFGKMEAEWSKLFTPFFITSTVLLMFNNSFCQLGFFWLPYGVYFAYLRKNKQK